MYRTSRETKLQKDKKMRLILMTASDIFARQGYANTSVKAIVDTAGLSVGTFYFYFKSKEELFELIYDAFIKMHREVCEYANNIDEFTNKDSGRLVEGFCRNKTAELWIFQKYRQIAKIMMIEAAGLNPKFEKKRAEFYGSSNDRVEKIFLYLNSEWQLADYDSKTAALLCNGTIYSVITEWLQNGAQGNVMDYVIPIVTYNLNAFNIKYQREDLGRYIDKMIRDMEKMDFTIFKEVTA